jgi:hypothetical protein
MRNLGCYKCTRLDSVTPRRFSQMTLYETVSQLYFYSMSQSSSAGRRTCNGLPPTSLPAQSALTRQPPWLNPGLAIKNVHRAGCVLLINETGLQCPSRHVGHRPRGWGQRFFGTTVVSTRNTHNDNGAWRPESCDFSLVLATWTCYNIFIRLFYILMCISSHTSNE